MRDPELLPSQGSQETLDKEQTGSPGASWKKAVWVLVWCLPAVLIGWLINLNGVDIPVLDQWDGTLPLFEKAATGTLDISDFFAQHNEHRIFFPRLVMFALGKLTRWNVRAEMGLIWVLGWLCLLSYWHLARVTGWKLFQARWLVFATAALVFTPLGSENWIWGFQIGFLLPAACFAASLWAASSVRFPLNFLLAAALSTICTFSVGSGFTCWLVAFPLLLLPDLKLNWRRRKIWWLLWAAGFLVTAFAYFHGYSRPTIHPGTSLVLAHPLQAVAFFLTFLGNPFAHAALSTIAGLGLVAIFALAAAGLWRGRSDRIFVARALPWVMCASIAFFNGALITAGRFGFGNGAAKASRYLPFSATLPIALLFLVPLVFQHWRNRADTVPRQVLRIVWALRILVVTLALLHLHLCVSDRIRGEWEGRRRLALAVKAVVALVNVVDDPEAATGIVHPSPETVKQGADTLNRLGYLRPALVRSKAIREIADIAAPVSDRHGEIQQGIPTADGRFRISGRALLPEKRRAADAVVLTCDDPKGEPLIFSLALVGIPRAEILAALDAPGPDRYRWEKAIDPTGLPPGARLLRAWAFDAEENRAYPLKGAADVSR